jgi:hypothetical protein
MIPRDMFIGVLARTNGYLCMRLERGRLQYQLHKQVTTLLLTSHTKP